MARGKARRSLALIEASLEILQQVQPATVRQVCYQLFVNRLIPEMTKNQTNRISRHVTDARETGRIPWAWIVDETREAERIATWADPEEYADIVQRDYRRDHWQLQPHRVEVWSEKGTVRGVLAPVLDQCGVTFRVMHGYASATAVHDVVAEQMADGRPLVVLYVGDWDPSGLHMSEVDLPGRLTRYRPMDWSRVPQDAKQSLAYWLERQRAIQLWRIALTEDDVANPRLPSFPADTKRRDPRWGWYRPRYGARCWELDALNPRILRERVKREIEAKIENRAAWARCTRAEKAERESLREVLSAWGSAPRPR